jgi:glycosyltransferase involved in cell wall biosynthesis
MKGLVTYSARQSLTSFKGSVDELRNRGIEINLMHFSERLNIWNIKKIACESRIIFEILAGKYDFVILNSGAGLLLRPKFACLLALASLLKKRKTYVLWRNAAIKFQECRARSGNVLYSLTKKVFSFKKITHLCISPQTGHDVQQELKVEMPICIWNCQKMPSFCLERVIPEDPPIVLNVGSVTARKSPDLFVDVAKVVCAAHPTVRFVWVGGSAPSDLLNEIHASGLASRIIFRPHERDPYKWMQKASVFFLSSRSEAFGLVIAEAMACSRTTICFAGTGAAEVIGKDGVIAPQYDVDFVASNILSIINKKADDRICDASRNKYLNSFSPDVYARNLETILRSANL